MLRECNKLQYEGIEIELSDTHVLSRWSCVRKLLLKP